MRASTKRSLWVAAMAGLGFALLVASSGCSLFKYTKTAPPPAPIKPPVPHDLAEGVRQAADYTERFMGSVYGYGAEPQAPAVRHAQAVSAVVTTHLGRPAEPLPLAERAPEAVGAPLRDEVPAWATAWMKGVTSLLAQHSERMAAHEVRMDRYGRTPVKTGWTLSSPALGGLVAVGVVILVGAIVIKVLLGRLGFAGKVVRQVVNSVQKAKQMLDAATKDDFVAILDRKQDEDVQDSIKRVKNLGPVR